MTGGTIGIKLGNPSGPAGRGPAGWGPAGRGPCYPFYPFTFPGPGLAAINPTGV